MFNVKADLPQNVSGKYTYYQSAFDLKKCCWNYTMFSLGFLVFFSWKWGLCLKEEG